MVKNLPAKAGDTEDWGSAPGSEDPLEEEMATHSNIPAWKISWTKKPRGIAWSGKESDTTEYACTMNNLRVEANSHSSQKVSFRINWEELIDAHMTYITWTTQVSSVWVHLQADCFQ